MFCPIYRDGDTMVNCNLCINIDYTEQEQHKKGIHTVPGHRCKHYEVKVIHGNQHKGRNNYISPCEQCVEDKYEQFQEVNR